MVYGGAADDSYPMFRELARLALGIVDVKAGFGLQERGLCLAVTQQLGLTMFGVSTIMARRRKRLQYLLEPYKLRPISMSSNKS